MLLFTEHCSTVQLFRTVSSSFPLTILFTFQESIDLWQVFLAFHRGSLLAQLIPMYRISFSSNVVDCTPAECHSLWTPQASPLHTTPDPHQYDNMTSLLPQFRKKQDIFQLECIYSNYSLFSFAGSSLLVNTIISCSVLLKLLCLVSGCHWKTMQGKI